MDKPILGNPSATLQQAKKWAQERRAADFFVRLADLYWSMAPSRGMVDPAVAYAQSAHETGYGHFGGVIDASYHNPCGLKITSGGDNNDPNAHHRFRNWEEGIAAHLDHLALYAGAAGYPRNGSPDPRHFPWIRGTAQTVYALGGRWAPSSRYGQDIAQRHLVPMQTTQLPIPSIQGTAQVIMNNQAETGFIIEGRVYVPVRFLSDQAGFRVEWNNATKTARIRND